SKTNQSPKKTSGIARLEWETQFPIFHSNCHCFLKRRTVCMGEDFVNQIDRDAARDQVLAQGRRNTILALGDIVFRKTAVIKKVLLEELLDNFFRRNAKFGLKFLPDARNRVIPGPHQLQRGKVDSIHGLLSYDSL